MNEITEILTVEITTIFRNVNDLPKLSNEQIAKIIKGNLDNSDFSVDDVVVTKQQRFIGEGKADAVH